ncbi:MAG TPA: hypothetical protein VFH43_14855, partial [Candidatus Kapabacteria bacterium]|nr:hypothetical protein [Candidatus Kapabacteria bacterium]
LAAGHVDRRGALFGTALVAKIVLSVLSGLLGVAVAFAVYGPSIAYLVMIGTATLFFSSRLIVLRTVLESFARAEGKFDLVLKFAAIDAMVFGGLLYLWSFAGLSLTTVVAIYSLCHIPGFLFLASYIKQVVTSNDLRLSFDRSLVKELFTTSFPVTIGIGFLAIHNMADTLILERLSNDQEVSAYAASFRIMAGLMFLPVVLTGVIIPEFVKLLKQSAIERAERLAQLSLQALISGAIFIALLISSLAPILVDLVLGKQYSDTWQLVIIFGWLFLPIVFVSLVLELGIAVGKQRMFGTYAIVLALVTIVGDLLVAGPYGALGVAIVKFTAMLCGCGVIAYVTMSDPILRSIFMKVAWGKNLVSVLLPLGVLAALVSLSVPAIVAGLITTVVFLAWSMFSGLIELDRLRSLVRSVITK